jgi:hypothetical protein
LQRSYGSLRQMAAGALAKLDSLAG